MLNLTIMTWNVGGVAYLRANRKERELMAVQLKSDLNRIVETHNPEVILLQETVRFEEDGALHELVSPPEGYFFQSNIAINSIHQNHPGKWASIRESGGWDADNYLGQGNGILWRKELEHSSIWQLEKQFMNQGSEILEEKVRIDTGLFIGNRNSEPRIACVYHFQKDGRDIFVVNLHLTTLRKEREAIPSIDAEGIKIRESQIDIILNGVVSRYNLWRSAELHEKEQNSPLWILAGDFNATPGSPEIQKLEILNFVDVTPNKGRGSKRRKIDNTPTLTVDYIFLGPAYSAFEPTQLQSTLNSVEPLYDIEFSDHYPVLSQFSIA